VIAPGAVLWFPDDDGGSGGHYHIIISDPQAFPDRVVLVNLTTWEDYKDDTCVLESADDLPFLRHKSCIDYGRAKQVSAAALCTFLKEKRIHHRGHLPADILARVRQGAAESRHIPNRFLLILEEQGIIQF